MDSAAPLAELDAMRKLVEALSALDPASIGRVLRWAHEQYGVAPGSRPTTSRQHASLDVLVGNDGASSGGAQDLAEFYAACGPKTDAHKTLVVSYWLQERAAEKSVDAQRVNTELKQLGHGVGNITRAFDLLIRCRPQLVIQTKKAGTSKQARKLYKVTVEGRSFVENVLATGRGSIDVGDHER
jgi:hypothetical protein